VNAADDYRIEHDTMGEVSVPAAALWQAQTQRAVENFPISHRPIDPALIAALGRIKAAVAAVKHQREMLSDEMASAIRRAADEVAAGQHDDEFPIDVFQTGSGTSSNMNANEVIASIAAKSLGSAVHPNDDVNHPLSSNDMFPSAIHIATADGLINTLIPALRHLEETLAGKAQEFAEVVKNGRTHLMDATPVTLGQEFGGYATQIANGIERVEATIPRVTELPLGGTAVGTGINMPAGFAAELIEHLADDTGLELTETRNHFEAQGSQDSIVEASAALRTLAVSLTKIANDLRWMGSGPRSGLGEIALPDLQPGSSIMPGKVNPVLCEATVMVAAQVIGNDTTITVCGAAGNFELNVMLPAIARNILESIQLLANVSMLLTDRCIDGITANADHSRLLAESSPSIVTPLNKYIGYENAAAVAKQALADGKTIRDVVIDKGFVADGSLSEKQLDEALDVLSMTHGSG
jgi:fumarate hydratase class II